MRILAKMTSRFVICLALLALTACDSSEDDEASLPTNPLTAATPNSFLQQINAQASLAVGDYTIVVATVSAAQVGDYELTVTFDNGETETFTGSWISSAGQVMSDPANPTHVFTLDEVGGIDIQLNSDIDGYLFLVKNNQLVAENGGSGSARITLAGSNINSAAYAQAYYKAVDPNDQRTTLAAWKTANGFDQGYDNHVIFRDAKDLGYGRDMYQRSNADGAVAVYVDNYVVNVFENDAKNYGPLNVEAAVEGQQQHYIGTNAIEFSPIDPADSNSDKVVKLFIFVPDGSGNIPRALSADLDGRGVKFMPSACYVCHGKATESLNSAGEFSLYSIYSAKFNSLEIDSFEYSEYAGYSRETLEAGFSSMNQVIHDALQIINGRSVNKRGKWSGDFAIEQAVGNYTGFSVPNYQEDFIPTGWQANANRPENVEQLYLNVVKPHCFACHSQQGTAAGEAITVDVNGQLVSLANAINFGSYEKFISYNDRIIEYVYRRGIMPLSLRNFEVFWGAGSVAPELLATFLDGFDRFDTDRNIIKPGRPFAKPGDDRSVVSPVQLNASASLFAASYQWAVVEEPMGASSQFSNTMSAAPVFSTDTDGEYVLQLTVSNALGQHSEVTSIVINSGLSPTQTELNFADDILPILGSETLTLCSNCHNYALTSDWVAGIPIYFDSSNTELYREVLSRINVKDPENSPLLKKPTGLHHGGGEQIVRGTVAGDEQYNTLLNWVREGALCGDNPTYCP